VSCLAQPARLKINAVHNPALMIRFISMCPPSSGVAPVYRPNLELSLKKAAAFQDCFKVWGVY
jgi:hypothetical protein